MIGLIQKCGSFKVGYAGRILGEMQLPYSIYLPSECRSFPSIRQRVLASILFISVDWILSNDLVSRYSSLIVYQSYYTVVAFLRSCLRRFSKGWVESVICHLLTLSIRVAWFYDEEIGCFN
jgi:hypothetical protein